jgi:hypothetical protein
VQQHQLLLLLPMMVLLLLLLMVLLLLLLMVLLLGQNHLQCVTVATGFSTAPNGHDCMWHAKLALWHITHKASARTYCCPSFRWLITSH